MYVIFVSLGCSGAREITRRYGSQGVIAIAVHPGVVRTELGRHIPIWVKPFLSVLLPFLKTPNQGAATQLWAAFDTEWIENINDINFGFYAKDCYIAPTAPLVKDTTFGELWYDYNESEITRIATPLGLQTSIVSKYVKNN